MSDINLTPTARLILWALRDAKTPQNLLDLALTTGASPNTAETTAQILCRRGFIERTQIGKRSYYHLPATETVLA